MKLESIYSRNLIGIVTKVLLDMKSSRKSYLVVDKKSNKPPLILWGIQLPDAGTIYPHVPSASHQFVTYCLFLS